MFSSSQNLILAHVAKHITLNKEEIDYFLSLLQIKNIKRKDFLLQANEICKTENFITKGCLRTYTIDNNGTEHILMFGVENWWVGDLYSFLTQLPATLFIDALEDTEVLQITKENLEKLYENVPKFERFFRVIIQNLSFTAEERYQFFIQKYPLLEQRISQKQIAAYLGITPVFLSMLRKKRA
jgi:CRP-like cAMP-binding protein